MIEKALSRGNVKLLEEVELSVTRRALVPILDELSRYDLQVTGLPAGQYEVTIDGELAAKVGADALALGINLSNAPGPITTQGREVLGLIFKKNDRYFNRWRSVQLFSLPAWANGPDTENLRATELKRLDAEIAAEEARIDAARKPKSHRFEVKPATP